VSDFSPEWLELREAADHRARSRDVMNALAARFALRDDARILDLGSGTGANLRATASSLPRRQAWTLVERDPVLCRTSKAKLLHWADAAKSDGEGLHLSKDGREITVTFEIADLAVEIAKLLAKPFDLVTASAFFDLTSEDYIRALVRHVTEARTVFYAALTYNGLRRWTPHRPADNQMAAAFHRHQMRDKGFGPAAGPLASAHLLDQFRMSGYAVVEGDSPWQLQRGDRMLIDELVRSHAVAVSEAGGVDAKTIVDWVNVPRTAASIGHTDILALPAF
jgi:hypothetical protein